MKASRLLTEDGRKAVEAAIAEAETIASGEIVVVLATRSGRYDRPEDLFGVVVGLAAVVAGWFAWLAYQTRPGDWGQSPPIGLLPILALFAAGFILGTALATRVPLLARLFLTRREMEDEVRAKAVQAFHRFRLRRTAGATGLAIYVSLFERMVRVEADEAVAAKIGDWTEVCGTVVRGLRERRPADGLAAAVRRAGELLAPHFPRAGDDRDELPNEVRVID